MLGGSYAFGLGVTKNPIEGWAWLGIAIVRVDEDAEEWIKEIELSSEQLIEAKKLPRIFSGGSRRTRRTNPRLPGQTTLNP